ncbi:MULTISPECIES: ornithine cyclodeaminase family protein [Bacillus]|uniref:ornithine cyclodeaminase family protein n=1 Tax=Bacillus TaxID=1386 RepID=UPI001B2B19A6|nr:ornithine cyclodeaminase family protein [Bacillus sonorensis]MCF7620097.1 ornithine cyclodeaminase family protein [Bacillus sonorensis]MCY8034466.1 ornithine cyclodeaminase family protein [Bacillus sonorensis]MCY8270655.1 ornithine cyclodeaminase family protein [Bacillus sonorensis]MCY8563265.1 ornithine cyclodeaminase family protein [Bacillus sonorensis]MCY8603502.1 ornithine cyclodeaminase family protein [Bacillus sonorensis]
MLVLSAEEQRKLVDMNEMIECAAVALKEFSTGRTVTPIRAALPFGDGQNTSLVMPSAAEELKSIGVKIVNVAPHNQTLGKKTINGLVILSDFKTGEPISLLEGSYVTMMRTGALSGVATKYLSRQDSKRLCMIGTGEQAKGLVEAVLAVRDIEDIALYNRTEQKAKQFADYIRKKWNTRVQVYSDANEAVRGADIIVTATNSSAPVFTEPLQPGVHVNAVGSFRPAMQELPSHVMSQADSVVVESREAALEETGDLLVPIREGVFKPNDIHAELGQIVNGVHKGRVVDQDITVFKSVGLAVVDIAAAGYLYKKAIEQQAGTRIQL